jgi:hypothetical protein
MEVSVSSFTPILLLSMLVGQLHSTTGFVVFLDHFSHCAFVSEDALKEQVQDQLM